MGNRDEITALLNYMETSGTKPVIDKCFPLKDAVNAQKYMENKKQFGKVLIEL